jgi:hypothetical protein
LEQAMRAAMEQLMRHHPAYFLGRREHHRSDLEAVEELESQHLRRRDEHEFQCSEPTWMIGELAAVAVILVVFCGVLTVIARLAGDASDTGRHPVVAVSNVIEPR